MRDTYPPTAVRTNLFIYLRGEEERRRGEERRGERGRGEREQVGRAHTK